MSISQDLIYYERFELKLVIDNSTATNFNVEIEGIDMTPYFATIQRSMDYRQWTMAWAIF